MKFEFVLFKLRNFVIYVIYKLLFRPIAFLIDPEKVHDQTIKLGKAIGSYEILKKTTKIFFYFNHPSLEQNILGIHFPNPVGLAAGFDKNAQLIDILPSIGFGFVEIGSITGEPCPGNNKPRLWRLKKSKGLLVNYGLKNDGAEIIANRLKDKKFTLPVGISIAKTNSPKTVNLQNAIDDYLKVCQYFSNIGDYWTINISCPNSFGGEPFTNPENLDKLLTEIDKIKTQKPIFLKISPDLTKTEINDIINIIKNHNINGFVCTNLTKKRNNLFEKNLPEKGGISGQPVKNLSNEIISYIYQRTKGQYLIIGVGGIFSANDAYEKIKLGASLVQLITGMIFEGPQLISSINLGLVELLKKDGFSSIKEAIGTKKYE
ncbi:MAG: dihydroorotate dehydrogenase 2 [Candidatus Parcubacteria bacterium]|nr:MAG: dihydroorotate dehydrogenase 2 [Candidatus Parcubacteria bacterium]